MRGILSLFRDPGWIGTAQDERSGSRAARYVAFVLGSVILCVGCLLMSGQPHPAPHAAYCANKLRQIGLACQMYANQDPSGRYPATPNLILETEDITPEVFICPASLDTPATGATTQATAANLTVGGHLSYVY